MSAALRPQSGAASHVGRVRQRNEDGYFVDEEAGLWAVADGMGGHQGGEWAAAQAVAAFDAVPMPAGLDARCAAVASRASRCSPIDRATSTSALRSHPCAAPSTKRSTASVPRW